MFTRTKTALCATLMSILLAFSLVSLAGTTQAHADELSDAQATLNAASAQLDAISAEYNELQTQINSLDAEIADTTAKVQDAQQAMLEGQEVLGEAVLAEYKSDGGLSLVNIVLSSSDISDLVTNMTYYAAIQKDQAAAIAKQRELNETFNAALDELNAQRDSQQEVLDQAEQKKTEAEKVVSDASAKVSEAEAAALQAKAAAMAQEQPAEKEISSDWNTNTERPAAGGGVTDDSNNGGNSGNGGSSGGGSSTAGWRTGLASAYGGSSDPSVSNPATTADGSICNDSSMGVAIPMAWSNYRSYFGRAIEISYGGKTVVATINDCGGLGGGSRSLDLQPGVFKAFGFSTCQAWGVRTVSYRIL